MRFYLGTHQPAWLARDLGVPLLVSHRRLAGRRAFPRASGPWALDSGGFTELSLHGGWRIDARGYASAVRRYADEIGRLDFAAPMDWMTESHVLARTGASLRTHQHRTVANYLRLRDLEPDLPFIPVLQGRSVADYHRCADSYEKHGVNLSALPLVGVGSVCRRQHTSEVEQIMRSLADRRLRLHGFGVKVTGLGRYADTLASTDSMAWSLRGRYVRGCSPSHRSESNCVHFALAWHARLLASMPTKEADQRDGRRPGGAPTTLRATRSPSPVSASPSAPTVRALARPRHQQHAPADSAHLAAA